MKILTTSCSTVKTKLTAEAPSFTRKFVPALLNNTIPIAGNTVWTANGVIHSRDKSIDDDGRYWFTFEKGKWKYFSDNYYIVYNPTYLERVGVQVWSDGSNAYTMTNHSPMKMLEGTEWVDSPLPPPTAYSNGYSIPYADEIWTINGKIYSKCSTYSSDNRVLEVDEWKEVTWVLPSGISYCSPNHIWTDGSNVYYSYGTTHLKLNGDTWEVHNWDGFNDFYGAYTWTDGTNIYYSFEDNQYILNENTWSKVEWEGKTPTYGSNIWTDGNNIYYSYEAEQYILLPTSAKAYTRVDGKWVKVTTPTSSGSDECDKTHVIEVAELPTKDIDMTAIYKCNGRFYMRSPEKLREVAMCLEIGVVWTLNRLAEMVPGAGVYYYTVPELPADGGVITDEKMEILHIYYVEKDKNLYLYMADGWVLCSEEQALNTPYLGVVSDISEIPTTEEGIYAIVYAAWDELVRGSAVVEVSELPTENISESAVYWCNGRFYKYGTTFFDIAVVGDEDGSVFPLMLLLAIAEIEFSYNFIPTKTTEGIKASINADSAADSAMHFYFIGDEKDEPVFLYINDAWVPLSQMASLNAVLAAAASSEDISYDVSAHEDTTLMYQGVIGTYDEAISMGYYVVGTCGWNAYMKPVGTFTFEENHQKSDVSSFKYAEVSIPDPPAVPLSYHIPKTIEELPVDAPTGSTAIVFGGD